MHDKLVSDIKNQIQRYDKGKLAVAKTQSINKMSSSVANANNSMASFAKMKKWQIEL